MENTKLWQLYRSACQRLLNEQDRDPHSLTFGCFDRRYWGWKLVDYAESTFQRSVYPLAWWLEHDAALAGEARQVLSSCVSAGLSFAVKIQHRDGSFDQAFPHEHSFGATAFLLHPLIYAFRVVKEQLSASEARKIEATLRRAADFLCNYQETHGFISNHLAGAVLSLSCASDFWGEPAYAQSARDLLALILDHQSSEGWFLEYDGADPGYQTLCMYYLAQVRRIYPSDECLHRALDKSVEFLSFFIHPDGTFAGEYGSRRTAVYYPGGLALLSSESDLARSMTCFMQAALLVGRTLTPAHVDIGNLAPLLSNYTLLLESEVDGTLLPKLPCEKRDVVQDFAQAGLHIRSTDRYYAILGSANGGVLKVFNRPEKKLLWNDGGYVGLQGRKTLVTTQMTRVQAICDVSPQQISMEVPFYEMPHTQPGPFQFTALRILNITVMRNIFLGNLIKAFLVNLLMRSKRRIPLLLARKVRFGPDQIEIQDMIRLLGKVDLRRLEYGRPFVSIHMASARYFENFDTAASALHGVDLPVDQLLQDGVLEQRVTI